MKTIYLVELRTEDTEWTPTGAFTTKKLAKQFIERQEKSDEEMGLRTKFYYHFIEIKLFNK